VPKKSVRVSVILDVGNGTCKVFRNGEEIATADFCFDNTQIRISTVDTIPKYQRRGYGRLMFSSLFLLAEQQKMPLYLWALDNAIPFYEKIGMLHLNNPEVQKRVIFGNIAKEDLPEKVDDDDFVWIPPNIKKKPKIFL
jgi:hypothetical protein